MTAQTKINHLPAPIGRARVRQGLGVPQATNSEPSDEAGLDQPLDRLSTPPKQQRGRPRIPRGEAIFSAVLKVYGTASGRRTATNLREHEAKGYLRRAPHYNSIFKTLEDPALTPILKRMIEESAAPLREIETDFAVDSTGFSTSTYERWFSHKYGREVKFAPWIKAHVRVGVKTNVVTSIEVTTIKGADCPQLPQLLETSRERFNVKTVAADKAYISHKNLDTIDAAGAFPLIPFKEHHNPKGACWRGTGGGKNPKASRELWKRMYDYYHQNKEEFYSHYPQALERRNDVLDDQGEVR